MVALADLVEPRHTAVVTVEVQNGVVGPTSPLRELADGARRVELVERIDALCKAARGADVRIVHCTAVFRKDRAGSSTNAPLLAALTKLEGHLDADSDASSLAIETDDRDIVVPRMHGVSPFMGTELDAVLRNIGVRTIVAAGVSLNVAITGLVINAVDLGYSCVVPRDAVVGIPAEYGEQVLENTLRPLAMLTTVEKVAETWR